MEKKMKLSMQAIGAVMMSLQKCIQEQCDIVPLLVDMDLVESDDGLVVLNPPVVRLDVPEKSDGPCCGGEGCKCGKSVE